MAEEGTTELESLFKDLMPAEVFEVWSASELESSSDKGISQLTLLSLWLDIRFEINIGTEVAPEVVVVGSGKLKIPTFLNEAREMYFPGVLSVPKVIPTTSFLEVCRVRGLQPVLQSIIHAVSAEAAVMQLQGEATLIKMSKRFSSPPKIASAGIPGYLSISAAPFFPRAMRLNSAGGSISKSATAPDSGNLSGTLNNNSSLTVTQTQVVIEQKVCVRY